MKLSKMDGVRTCECVNMVTMVAINELAMMCGIKAIVDMEVDMEVDRKAYRYKSKQHRHDSTVQIRMVF